MARILCLHGYTQDGEALRKQIGALRKSFRKDVEFVFINAPLEVKERDPNKSGLAFWHPDGDVLKDVYDSLNFVKDFVERNGPFNGVLGFSQGSSVITLYQSHFQCNFEFALVFSASKIVSQLTSNQLNAIDTPCLHVCGDTDYICPPSISSDYMKRAYKNISVYNHLGGHGIPLNKESKQILTEFIKSHL
eukprot:NODE_465_length_8145_cov_0.434999.p4 type:complete len:191 gc:universal NODE_465_length_8145_cov_0.434999:210-782(+)